MLNNINLTKIAINIGLLLIVAFLLTPNTANAVMPGCEIPPALTDNYEPIIINFSLPNITVPTIPEQHGERLIQTYQVKNLQCFVIGIYIYFAGVVGILATVMIMYGGVKYLVSMGSQQRMSDAKDTIFSAVVGLILVLGAYILLSLINPNLTDLRVAGLKTIVPIYTDCSPQAVPDAGSDAKGCGGTGTEPNGAKCRFVNCEDGEVCVKTVLEDARDARFTCVNLQESCERNKTDSEVCKDFTKRGIGLCQWKDETCLLCPNDHCAWYPVVNCPNETWKQVDCSVCLNNGGCGGNLSGENQCLASDSDIIYASSITNPNDRLPEYFKQNICCQKISDPVSGYNIGDTLCSEDHWDWNITSGSY